MSSITGQKTLYTNMTGNKLCPSDPCHPNPCLNNAQCEVTGNSTSTGYKCICLTGYTGPTCAEDENECTNACMLNMIYTVLYVIQY